MSTFNNDIDSNMDKDSILLKFGGAYIADENTFKMGIDRRITTKIAERFKDKIVLETCTGGGFTTIALAESATKVITLEINGNNQNQAIHNVNKAGLTENVEFILGNCLNEELLLRISKVDAAFLDPDWGDGMRGHVYKFIHSNTNPPADQLLQIQS